MSGAENRRLVLLRHAKSDWPEGVPDHDRPLAKRGRRDAPAVGTWLRDHGYLPDTVICSTARRTRETWERVSEKLGGSPTVTFEPRAYGASVQTLLYLVCELPATSSTALLIGHNPGISQLAAGLGHAERSMPTAAAAILEFTGPWASLTPGAAHLRAFITPDTLHP